MFSKKIVGRRFAQGFVKGLFVFVIGSGLLAGCSGGGASQKAVVDIPKLVNQSPDVVEKILGKPVSCKEYTNNFEKIPGNYCEYKVEGVKPLITSAGLTIRYNNNQARNFFLELPQTSEKAEAALLMAGIDVKGAPPASNFSGTQTWRGKLNGVDYKDVIVRSTPGKSEKEYGIVSVSMD